VRDLAEFSACHLPGSINQPYWAFRDGPDATIPRGRPVAVICAAGRRAALAASVLAREGFGPVIHVDNGGVDTVAAMGMPVEGATG
jgi:rhodanese-related sulfurtransferase